MPLKNITQNSAYQARKGTNSNSSSSAFNENWVDPTAPTTAPSSSTNWYSPDLYWWDEFASPISGNNVWKSFNYNTWTFSSASSKSNPLAPVISAPTAASNKLAPNMLVADASNNAYGKEAEIMQAKDPSYLERRNDFDINNIIATWDTSDTSIRKYIRSKSRQQYG